MKYTITLVLLAGLVGGCELDKPIKETGKSAIDVWAMNATDDSAIRNAIIRQSTLFPYEFEENSSELNSLGARDLMVLAEHFRLYPGRLNVRRGSESKELYRKRVQHVVSSLEYAGVPIGKIKIEDVPAGGDGIPTEIIVLILKADATGYKKASESESRKMGYVTTNMGEAK